MSNNRTNIVFLVSGNGGTLKFIHEYLKKYPLIELGIVGVVADRECGALQYARNESIPNSIIKYNKENRTELYDELKRLNPDIIVTNIYKILDEKIVSHFTGRLINFHYSLLPAFKGLIGLDTLTEALKLNCQFVGATCHHVDKAVDNGKIISQCLTSTAGVTTSVLSNIIFRANCLMALNVLHTLSIQGQMHNVTFNSVLGNSVLFSPGLLPILTLPDESFWNKIAAL